MSTRHLLVNKIKTPDGTILQSFYNHDYKTHRDANGEVYMVDGGITGATRRSVNNEPYIELSVYSDAPHEIIRENFTWGTYGKNLDKPLTWVVLCDMSDEHIRAVLDYKGGPPPFIEKVFIDELIYREKYDLHVEEGE